MPKRLLRSIKKIIKETPRLNIWATLRVNISLLPFKHAIKLPIYVYGSTYIYSLKGSVDLSGPIKSGMLRLGYRYVDLGVMSFSRNIIWIDGCIKSCGTVLFGGGCNLFVRGAHSMLELEENVQIGSGTRIFTCKFIHIGAYTQITMGCTVMDTNLHYIKDIENGIIPRSDGAINLGEHCWINAGSIITKGAVLPNYTIVARNSFVNKDYSSFGEYRILAGSPAKALNGHYQRIFNWNIERALDKQFKCENTLTVEENKGPIDEPRWSWNDYI